MMSCYLIPKWQEWNVNANDVMMMSFTLFASLVKSCLACTSHACMHGTCALVKYGTSKYLSGLAWMQANLNLGKLIATHFGVLNT